MNFSRKPRKFISTPDFRLPPKNSDERTGKGKKSEIFIIGLEVSLEFKLI